MTENSSVLQKNSTTDPDWPKVSIIILNWNGGKDKKEAHKS